MHYKTVFYPKYCDTCDSKKAKTPVDARTRTRARRGYCRFFHNSNSRFDISLFRVVHSSSFAFHKTSRRFLKNNTSFFTKQAVIFPKTTRRFSKMSRRLQ